MNFESFCLFVCVCWLVAKGVRFAVESSLLPPFSALAPLQKSARKTRSCLTRNGRPYVNRGALGQALVCFWYTVFSDVQFHHRNSPRIVLPPQQSSPTRRFCITFLTPQRMDPSMLNARFWGKNPNSKLLVDQLFFCKGVDWTQPLFTNHCS